MMRSKINASTSAFEIVPTEVCNAWRECAARLTGPLAAAGVC